MGILNVTPDSFSDGGIFHTTTGNRLPFTLHPSPFIIDVGGESTRPGFTPVSADEELRRVIPAITAIRAEYPKQFISIDTTKAVVAQAALEVGADIVNDVSGASDPDMLSVVRRYNAGYVLTHGWEEHLRLNEKLKMKNEKCNAGIQDWVLNGLKGLLAKVLDAGIPASNIALDPGFGFGKKGMQNAGLLAALPQLVAAFSQPILVGVSRKHFLCEMYGVPPTSDLPSLDHLSARCANEAIAHGAKIIRTHNPHNMVNTNNNDM